MTTPVVQPFPIRRPGFITGAQWSGEPADPQLSLTINFIDDQGIASSVTLLTKNHEDAELCLPTSATIADISDDTLVAHVRMAGMIAGAIPGSKEYSDALIASDVLNTKYFQSPIGDIKVTAVTVMSDTFIKLTFQKASGGATRDVVCGLVDLARYSFAPSTQLLVISGSIKKAFSTYIHDPTNNKHLTQVQMDAIVAYVLALQQWI